MRLSFTSNASLGSWLDENGWLADSVLVSVAADDAAGSHDLAIRIALVQPLYVESYDAGSAQTVRDVTITALRVHATNLGPEVIPVPGNCCEGPELQDGRGAVSFTFDVPDLLEVSCGEALIDVGPERREAVQPWTSTRELHAILARRPTPEELVMRFLDEGIGVCWRLYGGEAQDQPSDPMNYEGWHLQTPERVHATPNGLVVSWLRQAETGLSLGLALEDPEAPALWDAALRVVMSFNPLEVRSGNVQFSTEEWRRFVVHRELPSRLAQF